MNFSRISRVYIVPIAAYQAVAIAGGYGTGREVIEFFTSNGIFGGLYGLITAALFLGVVTALSFEFARIFRVYDYRSFFKELIGPLWILFEILYILLFLIVLAVVASAAGNILSSRLGAPENLGLILMLSIIACLLFFGRKVVERSLVVVTILLLSAFIYYLVAVLSVDGTLILNRLGAGQETDFSWLTPALQFGMYSAAVAVIILFSTSGIETRKEAFLSGGLCGLIFMIPGLLFHISFIGRLEAITEIQVPVYWMIDQIDVPYLLHVYLIAMFGTFLGTGLGFLQAVSERLDTWATDKMGTALPRWLHVCVAIGALLISAVLGQFGIIALIAKGYGTIAWGFLIVFIIPIMTIGVYKIYFSPRSRGMSTQGLLMHGKNKG
jgi:uncharacterized membrane protein YkvI